MFMSTTFIDLAEEKSNVEPRLFMGKLVTARQRFGAMASALRIFA
jgi:hypothetical protein